MSRSCSDQEVILFKVGSSQFVIMRCAPGPLGQLRSNIKCSSARDSEFVIFIGSISMRMGGFLASLAFGRFRFTLPCRRIKSSQLSPHLQASDFSNLSTLIILMLPGFPATYHSQLDGHFRDGTSRRTRPAIAMQELQLESCLRFYKM